VKFSEVELPSNKKFGFFFTAVFAIAAAHFYVSGSLVWVYPLFSTSAIFLVATIVKADVLLPLNKLWMRFGLLLGLIVSPIVLGVLFFGVFTPIAYLMRISGRDELRLRFKDKASHWVVRSEPIQSDSFKNQF
jgi:energy-coupling factor transporter transmembrane protein EcfT